MDLAENEVQNSITTIIECILKKAEFLLKLSVSSSLLAKERNLKMERQKSKQQKHQN